MWIFLNDAMLSIVAPPQDTVAAAQNKLLVRGRLKGDIERVFPKAAVTETPQRDYRFRALIDRTAVREALAAEVDRITYGNFKDSVQDDGRHDAYFGAWRSMHSLQQERAMNPPGRRKAQPALSNGRGKGRGFMGGPGRF